MHLILGKNLVKFFMILESHQWKTDMYGNNIVMYLLNMTMITLCERNLYECSVEISKLCG